VKIFSVKTSQLGQKGKRISPKQPIENFDHHPRGGGEIARDLPECHGVGA